REAIDATAAQLPDPLPADLRAQRDFAPLAWAIAQIHFPEDDGALAHARRRLAFEELLLLQLVMELRRRLFEGRGQGMVTAGEGELAARLRASLPWPLP